MKIHMACSKVDNDPENSQDLEETRHLTFKESVETRVVKDTISNDVSSSYNKPLKILKVNIESEESTTPIMVYPNWEV
jgi:hypothetical protein